jgi:hypothetical protein
MTENNDINGTNGAPKEYWEARLKTKGTQKVPGTVLYPLLTAGTVASQQTPKLLAMAKNKHDPTPPHRPWRGGGSQIGAKNFEFIVNLYKYIA